jgi:thiamine pyrophosphate-dependent acetolactate synthase large subunit-like protein
MNETPRSASEHMSPRDALQVLANARPHDAIVVTNQGSARIWPLVAEHPLDFHYNPSTMGGAVPFALGLALASAPREIIVVSGDGALLMSLGSLVSVVAAGAANLTVVVLDNGIYDVTGGQKTPSAQTPIDFAAVARGIGFPTACAFNSVDMWRNDADRVLASPGPRFIALRVEAAQPADLATAVTPVPDQLVRLRQSLVRQNQP